MLKPEVGKKIIFLGQSACFGCACIAGIFGTFGRPHHVEQTIPSSKMLNAYATHEQHEIIYGLHTSNLHGNSMNDQRCTSFANIRRKVKRGTLMIYKRDDTATVRRATLIPIENPKFHRVAPDHIPIIPISVNPSTMCSISILPISCLLSVHREVNVVVSDTAHLSASASRKHGELVRV